MVWTFFSECTGSSMQAIASNGGLIRKAYFPRSILVIAASISSLFTFLINLVIVFVIAVALHQIDIGLRIVMVIPLLLELYLLAFGISLFLSALFVQFHDVSHLWEVLMQLLFYASGVMFSLTYVLQRLHLALEVGAKKSQTPHLLWIVQVMAANPIMQTIEDLRHALLTPVAPWTELVVTRPSGRGPPVRRAQRRLGGCPVPFLAVILVVTGGALTFRSRARSFAENL